MGGYKPPLVLVEDLSVIIALRRCQLEPEKLGDFLDQAGVFGRVQNIQSSRLVRLPTTDRRNFHLGVGSRYDKTSGGILKPIPRNFERGIGPKYLKSLAMFVKKGTRVLIVPSSATGDDLGLTKPRKPQGRSWRQTWIDEQLDTV